jgi:hypothetical protein
MSGDSFDQPVIASAASNAQSVETLLLAQQTLEHA